jgi:hypothetical protein
VAANAATNFSTLEVLKEYGGFKNEIFLDDTRKAGSRRILVAIESHPLDSDLHTSGDGNASIPPFSQDLQN